MINLLELHNNKVQKMTETNQKLNKNWDFVIF